MYNQPINILLRGGFFMRLKAHYMVLCLGASFVVACTSIQPTYTSTGNQGYRINCGGIFGDGDLGSCHQSAGEACKEQGYRVTQSGVSSMIVECRNDNHDHRAQAPTNTK